MKSKIFLVDLYNENNEIFQTISFESNIFLEFDFISSLSFYKAKVRIIEYFHE